MHISSFVLLLLFIVLLYGLYRWQRDRDSLAPAVLAGLILGAIFGGILQLSKGWGTMPAEVIPWVQMIGTSYVNLLYLLVMPLVLTSILVAVVKVSHTQALGKISGSVLGVLLCTTAIAALIGVAMAELFGLSAAGLVEGSREAARAEVLYQRIDRVTDLSIPEIITTFVPRNIFLDLTGARSTSVIAVVIFAVLLGLAALAVRREFPQEGAAIERFVHVAQVWIMKLVRLVMAFTPYGVMALVTSLIAKSSLVDIVNLLGFVLASFTAIGLMFVVHGLLLLLNGVNPLHYFNKVWPVLVFAFSSRSSAATIPLNVETQVDQLRTSPAIANFSASFGATIGQNGCAGIYPAMLATMVAVPMGIDVWDPIWLGTLIAVVMISSFGIAGVGGGATFAALVVLPAMGLPVTIAALLISVEPLIDMARTALNVNGAMTAGTLTQRWLGEEVPGPEIVEG
ncbi:cation:dicarboxylase symporter family transporter [Microbulbifer sp. OS29]|uniref:Cation:dicarboxylase symporter family transporter n=1 Tax=Microbulbifer okhotskensis TaxID=2926617 RepID=A0A9X2EKU5_9GAMM|nr:cation:dicarboxylase symporter family transporter [Microbulbifer okhotskensis]MCO1334042.1 cation:dicarboxylase symporter family transporter [Microbulbifer okhotskensis]